MYIYIHLIVLFIIYPKRTCFNQLDASLSNFLLDRCASRAQTRSPYILLEQRFDLPCVLVCHFVPSYFHGGCHQTIVNLKKKYCQVALQRDYITLYSSMIDTLTIDYKTTKE